jgi:hypothetical protein
MAALLSGMAFGFTLQHGRMSAAGRTPADPVMALPAVAPVAAAGLGLLTLFGVRKASRERENFFSMRWNEDPGEAASEEACVLIGEETRANGKQWFVCSDDASIKGADCEPVEKGWGNAAAQDGEKLCKVTKVAEA